MQIDNIRLMNAAGGCKGPGPEFDALLRSAVTEITIGSITVDPRDGNAGDVFYVGEHGESVNSLGLPNPGMKNSEENLSQLVQRIHEVGKLVRVSISGTGAGTEEYLELIKMCIRVGADTIESNVGCPNIWKDGERKPLLSHDPETLERTLRAIQGTLPDNGVYPRIAVKASPMIPVPEPIEYRPDRALPKVDRSLLAEIAACFDRFSCINELVLINTIPNVRVRDANNEWAIKSSDVPNNAGGLAGKPILPVMLEHLRRFREQLPYMPLTAVGGISTGSDIHEALRAGASAVQVGTAWMQDATNARIFSDVLQEYANL